MTRPCWPTAATASPAGATSIRWADRASGRTPSIRAPTTSPTARPSTAKWSPGARCWASASPTTTPAWSARSSAAAVKSYDLEDHEQILAAYEKFLARWDFREAFPTAEKLFLSIGDKSYDFWGRVVETARLAESNDLLVVSGWESTAVEQHSGLVDNLRRFKGNPQLMARRTVPLRPVIKPHAAVSALGSRAVVDAFLLNETNAPAGARMRLWIEDPSYQRSELGTFDIPAFRKDRFVYPVKAGIETPVLEFEGVYRIFASVEGLPEAAWMEEISVVDPAGPPAPMPRTAAVIAAGPKVVAALQARFPGVAFEAYEPDRDYDLYVAGERLLYGWTSPDIDPAMEIEGTDDDELFRSECWGDAANLELVFDGLPKGPAQVTLRFAEVTLSGPGKRVFDVAINGRTVLKDFDVAAAAGGHPQGHRPYLHGRGVRRNDPHQRAAPDGQLRQVQRDQSRGGRQGCCRQLRRPALP